MTHTRQAMVLAAGRGERLRPLTDKTPKPLLTVGERPLLVHHLYKLAKGGFFKVVINLGWLGEQIPKHLAPWLKQAPLDCLEIVYSKEPPGQLETAGGIVHALHHFEQKPFLVLSADIMSDLDYGHIASYHLHQSAHLILVDNPAHHTKGDFRLDNGQVLGQDRDQDASGANNQTLTYAGVGLFSPELFIGLSPGHRPLRPVLDKAIADQRVSGEHFQGRWMDIGDPERLQQANEIPWD